MSDVKREIPTNIILRHDKGNLSVKASGSYVFQEFLLLYGVGAYAEQELGSIPTKEELSSYFNYLIGRFYDDFLECS